MSPVSIAAIAMRRSIRRSQRARLVEREVVGSLRAQQLDDPAQPTMLAASGRASVTSGRWQPCASRSSMCIERPGIAATGKHQIDRACRDGAARHAVIASLVRVLRDDEPARLLHGPQADAAIRAGAGQDHADGAAAVFLRQGMQQKIERQTRAVPAPRVCESCSAPPRTAR